MFRINGNRRIKGYVVCFVNEKNTILYESTNEDLFKCHFSENSDESPPKGIYGRDFPWRLDSGQ